MATDTENTWLGIIDNRCVTVQECRKWLEKGDDQSKRNLAKLLEIRLLSRYYTPHLIDNGKTNPGKFQDYPGFLLAACACMMIESLQRYRMDFLAESTQNHGEKLFHGFFSNPNVPAKYKRARLNAFSCLGDKATPALNVYKDIRCGILHVGESRSGWRLWRYSYKDKHSAPRDPFDDTLLIADSENRIIYADRFLVCVQNEVKLACQAFAEGDEWDSFKKAMIKTCDVCKPGVI